MPPTFTRQEIQQMQEIISLAEIFLNLQNGEWIIESDDSPDDGYDYTLTLNLKVLKNFSSLRVRIDKETQFIYARLTRMCGVGMDRERIHEENRLSYWMEYLVSEFDQWARNLLSRK